MCSSIGLLSPCSSTDSFEGAESITKRARKEEEKEGGIEVLTKDALYHIFKFLPFKDIIAVSDVCRRWREIATSSPAFWPLEIVFNRYPNISVLQEFNVNVCDSASAFLSRLNSAFQRISALPILNNAGATIVSITDASVNQLLKSGKFSQIERKVTSRIGDQKITGTWIIANSGLQGTGDMTAEQQRAFVESRGCEMAELVPVMALCNLPDSEVSLGDEPLTYLRCSDTFQSGRAEQEHAVIGGTTEEGTNIRAYSGKEKIPHYYAGAMIKIE